MAVPESSMPELGNSGARMVSAERVAELRDRSRWSRGLAEEYKAWMKDPSGKRPNIMPHFLTLQLCDLIDTYFPEK